MKATTITAVLVSALASGAVAAPVVSTHQDSSVKHANPIAQLETRQGGIFGLPGALVGGALDTGFGIFESAACAVSTFVAGRSQLCFNNNGKGGGDGSGITVSANTGGDSSSSSSSSSGGGKPTKPTKQEMEDNSYDFKYKTVTSSTRLSVTSTRSPSPPRARARALALSSTARTVISRRLSPRLLMSASTSKR